MENGKFTKNIERLGERYCQKYLNDENCNKQNLEKNWWEALKFFFSRSFMRGRRDELSTEYCCFTIETLRNLFDDGTGNPAYEKLKEKKCYFKKECILNFREIKETRNALKKDFANDFKSKVAGKNQIVKLLTTKKMTQIQSDNKTYNKKLCLGNDEDVMMVLDVLKFISNDGRKNIYSYIKNVMTESGVETAYKELTAIRGIGPKIASLIIRDIGLLNQNIVNKHFERAFPVDTWVRQVAKTLYPYPNEETDIGIQTTFIRECKTSKAKPLKVAAGLWYMGSHSLDILIELIRDAPNGGSLRD